MSRAKFYAGLFLLAFSTLMLEIVQTRLLSVVAWYHLAFFVISAAMFGMTGGAVWVYLNGHRYSAATLSHDLSFFTSAFALATAGSLFFQVTLAPMMVLSFSTVLVFGELALAIATPFFFSGVAVSLALTRSPYPIGRVYAADLVGGALGCLGVLVLLDLTDAPSAVMMIGAVAAGAPTLFAGSGAETRPQVSGPAASRLPRPQVILVVMVLLALANSATQHGVQPILVKTNVEIRDSGLLYERWNTFSKVIALSRGVYAPVLWGASPNLPAGALAEQVQLNIDGLAGTTMVRFEGDLEKVRFLTYDVTNLAYFLRRAGRSAVIGVGGGRDMLSAWVFGMRDITGVEINPIFVDLLTREHPFAEFAGIGSLDGVRLIVDEARSWFARTEESFDLIQMV